VREIRVVTPDGYVWFVRRRWASRPNATRAAMGRPRYRVAGACVTPCLRAVGRYSPSLLLTMPARRDLWFAALLRWITPLLVALS